MSPDLDKEFFLWVDACENGFGAVLEQVGDDNERHPVAFVSWATNDTEKKYPPTKLEMATIVFALNHFEVYLLGHKTTCSLHRPPSACIQLFVFYERSIKGIIVEMVPENCSVPTRPRA